MTQASHAIRGVCRRARAGGFRMAIEDEEAEGSLRRAPRPSPRVAASRPRSISPRSSRLDTDALTTCLYVYRDRAAQRRDRLLTARFSPHRPLIAPAALACVLQVLQHERPLADRGFLAMFCRTSTNDADFETGPSLACGASLESRDRRGGRHLSLLVRSIPPPALRVRDSIAAHRLEHPHTANQILSGMHR
jgi:hypothetical protein